MRQMYLGMYERKMRRIAVNTRTGTHADVFPASASPRGSGVRRWQGLHARTASPRTALRARTSHGGGDDINAMRDRWRPRMSPLPWAAAPTWRWSPATAATLHDRVTDVAAPVRLARATASIRQNVTAALGLKGVFLVTTIAGFTGLWPAVMADRLEVRRRAGCND